MFTEKEARTRWCPFSNVYIPYQSTGAGGNRALGKSSDMQGYEGNALCIASQCMAWRWADRPRRETLRLYLTTKEVDGVPVVRAGTLRIIKGESWRYEYTDVDAGGEFEYLHRAVPEGEPRRGYCGLASTPTTLGEE